MNRPMSEEEQSSFRQVGPEEAKKLLDAGTVTQLIDVREPFEYKGGHLPGAQLVPLNTFLRQPQQYLHGDNVLFVCASGERSAVASEMAAAVGLKHVYNLDGGTFGWMSKGYPVEK